VGAVGVGEAAAEELLVARVLEVVDLEPRAGDVDRLGMGGEASVGVADVVADVAGAGNHVFGGVAGLVEVTVPVLPVGIPGRGWANVQVTAAIGPCCSDVVVEAHPWCRRFPDAAFPQVRGLFDASSGSA
jgi:hypothetical protein